MGMVMLAKLKSLLKAQRDTDVLLIVPPFQAVNYPSSGLHLLQACGRKAGFRVQVLYANFLLASLLGEEAYAKICNAPSESFAGERFFARSAFGLPPLGRRATHMFEPGWVVGPKKDWKIAPDRDGHSPKKPITLPELRRLETYAESFVDCVAGAVSEQSYRIVGCTTTFEQTSASVAIQNRIKALSQETITILGGANCEGEMARGIASLPSGIDYVFSGESESTFAGFVRAIVAGGRPRERLIFGEPCSDMDALPTPTYAEFYEQRRRFLPRSNVPACQTQIPYETSRGCWWGEKHPCTFCGFNEQAIAFRQKSPDRVMEELRILLGAHPTRNVLMTDSIMPHTYFQTLLPRLVGQFPAAAISYEQKSNLSLPQVLALREAGITSIQPGIESLSSRFLTQMNKGVQARQNLMLMRFARAAGVHLKWNLLWGFPGDEVETYEETLALLPLLHHLQPPRGMAHLSIDRFSPYFSRPAEFGVRNIKPQAGCRDWLPKGAEPERIACHFTAEYRSGAHDRVDLIYHLWRAMKRWQSAWKGNHGPPTEDLTLFRQHNSYVLVDTRHLARRPKWYSLDERGASSLLTARPYAGSQFETWGVGERLAVLVDGWFVPLAVADPKILLKLTGKHSPGELPAEWSGDAA